MKTLRIIYFLLFFASANFAAQGEIWFLVLKEDPSDSTKPMLWGNVTIELYDQYYYGYTFHSKGKTTSTLVDGHSNAWTYFSDEGVSGSPTVGPVDRGARYLIKINSYYCVIEINTIPSTPDITITFFNGNFTADDDGHGIISIVSQGSWNTKTVTVKNDFAGGKLNIADSLYTNVQINGITQSFGIPTFPHRLIAFNYNEKVSGYKRYFQNWIGPGDPPANLAIQISTPSTSSATYQANFKRECDLQFENKFVGLNNCGSMLIEGVTKSLPTSTYYVLEDNSIQVSALNQTINGIEYSFEHWNDGTQNYYTATKTFTADSHRTYKAYFVGKPTNSGKNVQLVTSLGQPITITWVDNINTNVSYHIYRTVKHDGIQEPEVLIGVVNKGVQTFTDYDYVKASTYINLLHYDVRSYYSVEGTYSEPFWKAVYGEMIFKMNQDHIFQEVALEVPTDYSINNYPNPFNPTTTIKYQLPEAGMVMIKVYDILGKEVAELVNEPKEAGYYEVNFDANNLTSGVYIYTIRSGKYVESKKMIFTK